ncbi:hypothetical protein J2S43_004441 [Catenuloplanes nepalensis]|uniref:S-adenosyl methyltransferase n=1 Tax=Catenuloplanes nepalensis TaxID=587533 RepID=A0ABT9MWV9_9ACTN|nr:SAM-dependent methyltransferase [Catenuloplanes nepalensis]MDP9795929.1 hypothetical protein [Catenuloplanes nepalensis]
MNELPDRIPDGVDVSTPNAARMYDHALGGYHHFAADRAAWRRITEVTPNARRIVHSHRAFLGRAVRRLAGQGVRQFLDIGAGLPTLGNTHEVALDADPAARVIYVDNDPLVVVQSRALLGDEPRAQVIEGDLRRPEDVLYHPEVLDLLDFGEPVAVLLVDLPGPVPGETEIVARLGRACVSGSHLVVSGRSDAELTAILDGFDLVDPGVVPATDWHPDPFATEPALPNPLAAVARKR